MKYRHWLSLSTAMLALGSSAYAQTVTYQNSQNVTGVTETIYKGDRYSRASNDLTKEASISGKIRAVLDFSDIVKPSYISYIVREWVYNSLNGSSGSVYGGMLDLSNSYFIDSSDPGLSLAAGSHDTIAFTFGIELRGVNITRDGAVGDEIGGDGQTLGHTTYAYKRDMPMVSPWLFVEEPLLCHNWQNFHASWWGPWNWDATTSFQWSPAYSGATFTWNKWSIAFGDQNWTREKRRQIQNGPDLLIKPEGWEGFTGASLVSMNYSVNDTYGPGRAEYGVKIHDHLEKSGDLSHSHVVNRTEQLSGYAIYNADKLWQGYDGQANRVLDAGSVTENHTYTESISVSGDLEIGCWAASVGHDWQTGYELGVTTPISGGWSLPPETYTYVEVVFPADHYNGPGKKWAATGAHEDTTIDFTVPLPPTVQYHYPPVSMTGGGGNGGSSGGGTGTGGGGA